MLFDRLFRPWRVVPRAVPPTTGVAYALFADPLEDTAPIAGSAFKSIEAIGGGLVALKTAGGQYLSQEPLQRGVIRLAPAIGAYETWGLQGSVVTSWTRPGQGDPLYSYCLARIPNAA